MYPHHPRTQELLRYLTYLPLYLHMLPSLQTLPPIPCHGVLALVFPFCSVSDPHPGPGWTVQARPATHSCIPPWLSYFNSFCCALSTLVWVFKSFTLRLTWMTLEYPHGILWGCTASRSYKPSSSRPMPYAGLRLRDFFTFPNLERKLSCNLDLRSSLKSSQPQSRQSVDRLI